MKLPVPTLLLTAVWASGCVTKNLPVFESPPSSSTGVPAQESRGPAFADPLIVTPDVTLTGRVVVYNSAGRFVVLDFPVGQLPANDQVMFVFRQGLKVGEVKVTGPRRDHNTVADLVSGEARMGDAVRDR